jgi:hypothetical protein
MARKAASKVGRGTFVIASPRSWTAASSLKAPGSPWKATRILEFSAVVIRWPAFLLRRNCNGVTGWAQETSVSPRGAAPYDEMKTWRLQVAGLQR